MQLKSFEPESSGDFYDQLLDSLTITTDFLSDPNILKDDHVYFCDLGHVCERLEAFRSTFNKVQPCYPVECNDAKNLISVLANSGVSFSCSNKQNVRSVCDVGRAKSAMFGSASVQKSHLKYSLENGIEVMTFQNELELKKLAALQLSPKCRFVIQFNWDFPEESTPTRVQQMKKLIKIAQKKQLKVAGLSLGQVPETMKKDMKAIIESCVSVLSFMESMGFPVNIFDLGSCCSLAMDSPNCVVPEASDSINSVLDELVFLRWPSLVVLADVGYLVARSAFSLMVTVTGLDENYPTNSSFDDDKIGQERGRCVYINDSVYGSFSKSLQNSVDTAEQPKLITAQQSVNEFGLGCENVPSKAQEDRVFCVRGNSGDALDIVSSSCLLSENVKIGDKLLFDDMGDFHCIFRTANGNGETPPTVHSFINANQIEIAKRLKRKTFTFKVAFANNGERLNFQDFDNPWSRQAVSVGTCSSGCAEVLTHSEYDVIFENIALLEQNHMSAGLLANPEDVFPRFRPDNDEVLTLLEQVHYPQNPFAFI